MAPVWALPARSVSDTQPPQVKRRHSGLVAFVIWALALALSAFPDLVFLLVHHLTIRDMLPRFVLFVCSRAALPEGETDDLQAIRSDNNRPEGGATPARWEDYLTGRIPFLRHYALERLSAFVRPGHRQTTRTPLDVQL